MSHKEGREDWTDFFPTKIDGTGERFVIAKSDSIKELFWSNVFGWVSFECCDTFSLEERLTKREPLDGFWMSVARAKELIA
jgi:hypothetical protein